MKRYSISIAERVNEQASKTGFRFCYSGRTDDWEAYVERYKRCPTRFGIRITDSQTKKVVFEDLRPVKGILTITKKELYSDEIYTFEDHFSDLTQMRDWEHEYLYGRFSKNTINVERKILAP